MILLLESEVVAIQRSCRLLVSTPASKLGRQVEVTLLEAHRLPMGLVSFVRGWLPGCGPLLSEAGWIPSRRCFLPGVALLALATLAT